jgi:hypothetical protein
VALLSAIGETERTMIKVKAFIDHKGEYNGDYTIVFVKDLHRVLYASEIGNFYVNNVVSAATICWFQERGGTVIEVA